MTPDELKNRLSQLIGGWESEVVEFKEANTNFATSNIGQYFSALANEANLKNVEAGWLVFGVNDRSRAVVGTNYRTDPEHLQSLKMQITQNIDPKMTFRDVHELDHPDGRVLIMEIPAAPRGIPIAWKGHYYARDGESLTSLHLNKLEMIREQAATTDWTAMVIPQATLGHLDSEAIARAKAGFFGRHPRFADEVSSWSDANFLEKARLTIDGGITRAAVLLLGKDTSAHLLSPHPAELTWKLDGPDEAYEHFRTPFLLNATALAQRIRNIQLRLLPPEELIYREISKYDERSILEALYNCIAHQDYRQNARAIVIELDNRIEFISVGSFYDHTPEDYMISGRVPREYRNPFLVAAMTELNLIDHMGNGIHRMVQDQITRFLPLPDYDVSNPNEVKLTIPGSVIDKEFSKLLMVRTDLPLVDVLALDRVQKRLPISQDAARRLRRARLIEGRKPHLHIAATVAAAANAKAEYIRTRAQDDDHYAKLVTDYLNKFDGASRQEINDLLWEKLSEALDDGQKRNKITNLLSKMRRSNHIRNVGTKQQPRWELV